jgi:hypothetical protein
MEALRNFVKICVSRRDADMANLRMARIQDQRHSSCSKPRSLDFQNRRDSSPIRGAAKKFNTATPGVHLLGARVRMGKNSSGNRRSVLPASKKHYWRLWLAGLLLPGTCFAQNWGSVAGGYIYLLTESAPAHWTSSHGWNGRGTFNINKQVGLFADVAAFYATGQNIHVQLYGVLHAFVNRTRFTPSIFIGPGFIRNSKAGTVNYSFAACAGGGLSIRLMRWVSFQTIPVEYVMNTANWNVGNNFVARAGFALTIPKK